MTEAIINEEALELVVQKLDSYVWTDKDREERDYLGRVNIYELRLMKVAAGQHSARNEIAVFS